MKKTMRWGGRMLALLLAVGVLAAMAMFPDQAQSQEIPGVASQLLAFGLAGVKVDLKRPVWDKNKTLYRAGKNVEMPEEFARELKLIKDDTKTTSAEDTKDAEPDEDGFLPDFPGLKHLKKAGLTREDVGQMSREDLIALPGIGEATADQIVAETGYQAPEGDEG